jgi:hypothetical protein
MKIYRVLFLFVAILYASTTFSQEQAPLKKFEFSIGVNHLKTQEQADRIVSKLNQIHGVEKCSLILTDYTLTFQCSNWDLEKYMIIDMMKQIFVEEDAEIVIINRKTISEDDSKK